MVVEFTNREKEIIKKANDVMDNYKKEQIFSKAMWNIYWRNPLDNSKHGKGFKSINRDKIFLTKCPACHKENYALSVASGLCCWCPFDANADKIK